MNRSRTETIAKVEEDLDRLEAIVDEAKRSIAAIDRVDGAVHGAVHDAAERGRSLAPFVVIAAGVLTLGATLRMLSRRRP